MRSWFFLLWAVFLPVLLDQAHGKTYTFYGVAGLSEEQFLNQWRPIFEGYLTEEVGKVIANVSFIQKNIESREVDFLFVCEGPLYSTPT
jgi:hypothetical protein